MGLLVESKGKVYEPAGDVDLGPHSNEVYLHADVKAPRMAGVLAKVFAWFLELRFLGNILLYILKRNNRIHKLVSFAELEESPLYVPLHPNDQEEEEMTKIKCLDPSLSSPSEQVQHAMDCLRSSSELSRGTLGTGSFRRWTISDYSRAYTSRQTTPLIVANRLIDAIRESASSSSETQMSYFINYDPQDILRQATESTLRHQSGKPLSALDGVPVAVKDEIDCMPYPTTGGTKWLHKVRECREDAGCVKRLRACGAILVGKTNMHELGAGASGINPHYGAPRNPYDSGRITGGSSSGSAAVVSAGLCPVALGVDGGGNRGRVEMIARSVRLPAALCGVVGLKPSFGRISHSGVLPLNWTVGMVGILAGTVEDAMIVYAAISGEVQSHQITKPMPIQLPLLTTSPKSLSTIKLAKSHEWFNDCTDDINVCCSNALAQLQKLYGWEVVDVTMPEIEVMRLAHYVTIGSECSTSIACHLEKLDKAELGWDVRVALAVYGAFNSREYLNAQRIRNRQMQFHQRIFEEADVIVTPTTAVTAYPIQNDALKTGELDYINGAALVRYQIAGNFLGLPAITVPIGYDKAGLPIGIQFIGKPWSESMLISIANAVQELCLEECKKPMVFYDLLTKS